MDFQYLNFKANYYSINLFNNNLRSITPSLYSNYVTFCALKLTINLFKFNIL